LLTITHGGNLFAICRERGWDWRQVLDLSACINPLGPAPGVRPALEEALDRIAYYPGPGAEELEALLAASWGIAPELVLAGAGATGLMHFLARAGWQGPAAIVTPAWSEFYRAFPHALRLPPNDPGRWPLRGLLALSQPANPTGAPIPPGDLRQIIAAREGPVVIDETGIEFTGLESAIGWCNDCPNLIVIRSLSKFHALPGLRMGALAGSREWIDRLRRRREPWMVSVFAEAGARAALADSGHAAATRELVNGERDWLLDTLSGLAGLRILPGVAGFLFAETVQPAGAVCDWFLERQILLRNCTGLPGVSGEAIRFAIRTRSENERFAAAAREFFCAG
jgi:threonine-phosphate decarboxylase